VKNVTPSVLNRHRNAFVDSFDSIFDKLIQTNFPTFASEFGVDIFAKGAYPKVNITDFDHQVVITAEVAGLSKEDVDITVKEGVLTISGARVEQDSPEGGTIVHRELKKSSFKRSWTINPDVLDATKATAKFTNGILDLTIPKLEPKKEVSHKIEIQ
tara:strand:+ start:785 stop:1255 length:471 start_codon:yes stop_codon:yes gene_type:complete